MSHVLITGSTGMVGKGVLFECLNSSSISSVTVLNRSSIGLKHAKLKEVLLNDFMKLESIKSQLGTPDACFHSMGVSAIGLSEKEYSRLTYDISRLLADICFDLNPAMTFIYISGTGTDSTEKGKIMWARVKGKTENYILNKGFSSALMFRPGAIIPEKGTRSKVTAYRIIYALLWPFFPLLKSTKGITTTTRVGQAMVNAIGLKKCENVYFENEDINGLAKESAF